MKILGEPIVWILAALAVVMIITYIERMVDIRRAQVDHDDFLKGLFNILDSGNLDEAQAVCDELNAPVARIASAALRNAKSSENILRQNIDSQGKAEVNRLDRRLAALSIIGQISPLVGFLGAIIGFIKTVIVMNSPDVICRAALLDGMMSAMIPAALGLVVAIPAAIMYCSLKVRLDHAVVDLESAANQLFDYFTNHGENSK